MRADNLIRATSVQEENILSFQAQRENFPLWYIIHIRNRHELKVAGGLTKKNLEIFLPIILERSQCRDRLRMLETPLFPGYLFVHTDLNYSDYYHIIRQDGVVRILGIKGQFTPVPEETIASIRKLINSGQSIFPWSQLKLGKRLRVVNGPLAGAIGVIMRLKKGGRLLVVGVELLGRSICVELADDTVEPLK